jgi:hypothetical protein
LAQAAVHLLPFRWIVPSSRRPVEEVFDEALSAEGRLRAHRIGWAIQTLSRYHPWKARCLAQAVAGMWMLQRSGLPGRLYLGVDHGKENWLDAHAWLSCGTEIITGEAEHDRFKVIAAFPEEKV